MDRPISNGHPDWQNHQNYQAGSPATYPHQYLPPTAQPPIQFSFSDPFQTNRDPFLHHSHSRNESGGPSLRAWHSPQAGYSMPNGHSHLTPSPQQSHALPPPPPPNGLAPMSLPYDPSRRKSLGANGSPLQHPQGPVEPPPPPQFQSRRMPPPSPPQMPSSASSLPGSAPRGPPTASPFAGIRDLASYSSNRPSGGMSISSILDANDSRKSHGSPLASTPKSMPPPSPGRVRSSSMREGFARGVRDVASPPRSMYREPKTAPQAMGHDRTVSEPRRDGLFASPQFGREPFNNFRAFQPPQQEQRLGMNGHAPPARPSSQPSEPAGLRRAEEIGHRDAPVDGRTGGFRPFVEPREQPAPNETPQQYPMTRNGYGPAPRLEDLAFSSPQLERERVQQGLASYQPGAFATPMREEQAGLFRPAYPSAPEPARESIEMRQYYDAPRPIPQSSPPIPDYPSFDRSRNGFADRPMTYDEHRRMEALQQRKESDGSLHRAILNISPEANRKGRNSPLPQAVQGAQPRHIGGGGNPSVKMEFGRMFSGLGSGVGTATPTAGQANGTMTPTRMTPVRQVEGGDLVRTAVAEIEGSRRSSKADSRGGKRNHRGSRDDEEKPNGRETPEYQRGTKRAKTNHTTHHHHHHVHPHHHHHHHQPLENSMPNPFNTIRFQPNPLTHSNLLANANTAPHHHHHHHATHAHPGHHHHHAAPRAAALPPRKPTTTVTSKRLVEECGKRPRRHLGSQLYSTEPSTNDASTHARVSLSGRSRPIPNFTGKENCTFTVRVPRWYLASSQNTSDASFLEEICKRRQLWGTDVYTDDSDVIAAAVHSGWLKGDFGEFNADLHDLCGNDSEREDDNNDADHDTQLTLSTRPTKPVKPPEGYDAHITLLILPALQQYAATCQHYLWSHEWSGKEKDAVHDGMSFMIHSVEFVREGREGFRVERTGRGRKERIGRELERRREAARALVSLFGGGEGVGVGVGVAAAAAG